MAELIRETELFGTDIPRLEGLREKGRAAFRLPTPKTEAWKYTRLHVLKTAISCRRRQGFWPSCPEKTGTAAAAPAVMTTAVAAGKRNIIVAGKAAAAKKTTAKMPDTAAADIVTATVRNCRLQPIRCILTTDSLCRYIRRCRGAWK